MQSTLIPQAAEIVRQAIEADQAQDYEKALPLYRRALEYFLTGIKYETNKAAKDQIMDRINGYMKRAEELKNALEHTKNGNGGGLGGGPGGATASKEKGKNDKEDDEKSKMRGALSASIISEKPNVKWDDVAGLEGAKEALKEAVILPTKFPQLFTGKRKPWKGKFFIPTYY
jgi:vacuolar protein-sorting-associated protein 4